LMFKGAIMKDRSKEAEEEVLAASVGRLILREWAYAALTLKVKVKLRDVVVDAMLDTRAEVNVMTKALAD